MTKDATRNAVLALNRVPLKKGVSEKKRIAGAWILSLLRACFCLGTLSLADNVEIQDSHINYHDGDGVNCPKRERS